jgi:starch synthase (maltosyl-transferring)
LYFFLTYNSLKLQLKMQNQTRIVIENVNPQLDSGAFFIKRIIGQKVIVTANVFSDGHDVIASSVKYKHEKEKKWQEIRMQETGNDEWIAQFKVEKQGFYSLFCRRLG